ACNNSSNGSLASPSEGRRPKMQPSDATGKPAPRQQPSSELPAQSSRSRAGSITPTSAMCPDGPGEVRCFDPATTHFNIGNAPTDTPPPNPPPEFDANRCQVRAQVYDGCCNPAVTGPSFEKGQCCYGFCTGLCCGRPLFVAGEARVALSVSRDDWLETLSLGLPLLATTEK